MEKRALEANEAQVQANKRIQMAFASMDLKAGEKKGVENALRALSVCKETLGKVKVVFAHAKRFWDLVRISADELNEAVNVANMIGEDTREKSDLEAIREEMFKSAQGW